jgi:ATP-dependent Clp protease ATP-binding subunit ClpA
MLNQYLTETVKLSFVLFDEIEKASDALWNLLLGILDKATLTLGDNRRVDFSRTMIFLTGNLGAREIESLVRPKLGFAPAGESSASADDDGVKISHIGMEAARRRFSPEFMNRLDKVVVFRPLGPAELRGILDLELELLRGRINQATGATSVNLELSAEVEDFILHEGTDARYGARHLKRTLERLLVQPLANLIATGQIQTADSVQVELDRGPLGGRLLFFKQKRDPAGRRVKAAASSDAAAAA